MKSTVLTIVLALAWLNVACCEEPRPTLEQARRQAEVLHTTLHATLQAVHHRYYREDEGLPIPAAMLKEVFTDLEKEQQVKLRWLAVEGQAMNTDHKPKDDFETQAVQALKAGKGVYEATDSGIYRRAGAITLGSHCLKCHVPDRKSTQDRTAGLIIALPVQAE
jgi:hypothetical protein